MGEHSNASCSVALRREVRRKKILENLSNRLKLIEGTLSSNESLRPLNKKFPMETEIDSNNEPIAQDKLLSDTAITKACEDKSTIPEIGNPIEDKFSCNILNDSESEIKESVSSQMILDNEKSTEDSKFIIACKKKLHYIFLAVVVNILLYFNIGHVFYNNIFCPFWTIKIVEIFYWKQEEEETNILAHILVASLPKELQKTGKFLLSIASPLFSDLFLYIFIFIIGIKILDLQY